MLLAAAEAAIYDAQTLSLRGKFYFPKKKTNRTHTNRVLFAGDGKETEFILCVFRKKRKCGTRDEVRAIFPNVLTALEHMG